MHSPLHRKIVIAAIVAGIALLLVWGIAGHRDDDNRSDDVPPPDATGAIALPDDPDAATAIAVAPPPGANAVDLFKRKVNTLSDPEWNTALSAWAMRKPEFGPWLVDEASFAVTSRKALQDDPEATFEALMPRVATYLRGGTQARGTPVPAVIEPLPPPAGG